MQYKTKIKTVHKTNQHSIVRNIVILVHYTFQYIKEEQNNLHIRTVQHKTVNIKVQNNI